MRAFRLMYEILTPEDRRGVIYLIPVMLMASVADMVVIAAGTGFVTALTDPAGFADSTVGVRVGSALGIQGAAILYVLGGVALSATLFGNIISLVAQRMILVFGSRTGGLLSARLLASFLHQPYEFFLVRDPASLASRVLVESNGVVSTVLMGTLTVAARAVGGVVIMLALVIYDPGASLLLVLVVGSTYAGGYALLRRYFLSLGRRRLKLVEECHHITHESLDGVKEVQIYGLADETGSLYRNVALELARLKADFQVITSSMRYLLETVGMSGIVLVAFYFQWTGRPVSQLAPMLAAYGLATLRLLPVFQQFYMTMSRVQLQLPALQGIHEDFELEREEIHQVPVEEVVPFDQALVLRGATYSYPSSEQTVFENLELDIAAGDWVAFVGTTGAGKSTLVDALLGLLDLKEGSLTVDGVSVDRASSRAWQAQVGYVPQHIFIRRASLRENIAFVGDIENDEIWRAVRIADLETTVNRDLEQGLDTQLGPRGQRLSGGQRQRVGIARAVAQRPRFLVLDEATSALDNETEAAVVRAMREELPDTTVVMIAHRLTSTRYCDRIYVLERGRIVEQGSYDELAEANGRFATMLAAAE